MIDRHLSRKFIEQSFLLWLGCGLALFSFCWVRVGVVSLLDMGRFKTVVEQFREYERFSPISFDQLFTYAGRVGMTFDEPVVLFCIVVWAIARGSDVISGELNRGTLEMLLSQPISRTRFLVTHAIVSISGLLLLTALIYAGIWIGVQLTSVEESVPPPSITIPWIKANIPLSLSEPAKITIAMRDEIDCRIFLGSCLNLFAFGYFLLGFSTLMSSWDRYRWRTIGLVITVYVFQLVIFGLGKAAESLKWLTHLTFFDLYRPQPIAQAAQEHGLAATFSLLPFANEAEPQLWFGPLAFTLVLLALGTACYVAALTIFQRRDLPAPL